MVIISAIMTTVSSYCHPPFNALESSQGMETMPAIYKEAVTVQERCRVKVLGRVLSQLNKNTFQISNNQGRCEGIALLRLTSK